MMAKARPYPWTVEDFLAFEAEEPERYEFVDGIVRMMTGGSAAHSAIKGNVFVALRTALRSGPCRVDVEGLKVVTGTAVMYPDVVVIGRPLAPDDDRMSDPAVVVEVLSPTTVLIAQNERRVEVQSRTARGWELIVVEPPEDTVVLEAVGATLSLEAIYENSGR
jgi:Uma2 family endonuclease